MATKKAANKKKIGKKFVSLFRITCRCEIAIFFQAKDSFSRICMKKTSFIFLYVLFFGYTTNAVYDGKYLFARIFDKKYRCFNFVQQKKQLNFFCK